MDAHTERSVKNGIKDMCPRESYPNWADAKEHAGEALVLAVDAATKAFACDDALSIDQMTEKIECLQKRCEFPHSVLRLTLLNTHCFYSLKAVPTSHKAEIDLLHAWDEEDFAYC